MSGTPALPENQAQLLEEALVAVRQQTAQMRKCLDTPGKLMDALKCWYVADSGLPIFSFWGCMSRSEPRSGIMANLATDYTAQPLSPSLGRVV